MDKTLIEYWINIIIIVPIIVSLIIISLRLSRKSIETLNIGSYTQVIERFNMTKDTTLYVIRTGKTGCVLVSSAHHTEVIKELSEEDVNEIINAKKEKRASISLSAVSEINFKEILNNNIKGKRKDGYNKRNFI